MIKLAAFLFLATPIAASAAPFCLTIPGAAPQCVFYDGTECAREAGRQNGNCEMNGREQRPAVSRMGDYCMITPAGYSMCGYADGSSCARDALAQHGTCSKSSGTGPKRVPDTYSPNAGR